MDVLLADTADEVVGWLTATAGAPFLAVDTETTGWDPWTDRLRLVQVAADPDSPVLVLDTTRLDPTVLGPLLADPARLKVFHNAAFDLRMLWRAGLPTARIADTMLAQQLLDGASPTPVGASLAAIAEHRLGRTLDKSIRDTFAAPTRSHPTRSHPDGDDGRTADPGPSSDAPLTDAQIAYGAADARATWDVFAQQVHELRRQQMVDVARLEFAAVAPLAAMQLRGLGIDADAWRSVVAVTEQQLPDLEAAAQAALVTPTSPRTLFGPEPVNLDSPEQVQAALARAGVDVPSTREHVLADHAAHPAVAALLAYRQAAKITSGWGGDWVDRARHPVTRRIHPSVRQIVGTGRIAHSDPNITQVPGDPAYRCCFTAAPGHVLVTADYSQQELRVLAAVSGDEALAAVFADGADLHTRTAAAVFATTEAAVTPAQRKAAKALNFGIVYGMGAAGVARATGTDLAHGRAMLDGWFAAYPRVAAWVRRTESQARRTNRVATPLGRARHLTDAGTFARNAPIQGAGADMIKLALAAVDARLQDRFGAPRWDGGDHDAVGLVLSVHDELVAEVPAADAEEAAALVEAGMVAAGAAVLGEVPVAVEVRVGTSWGG